MKVLGVIVACEPVERLRHVVAGQPVLRHVIQRLRRCEGFDDLVVVGPAEVAALIGDDGVTVVPAPQQPAACTVRAAAARKWAQDAWRGGPGEACVFDEHFDAGHLERLVADRRADAVFLAAGTAVLIDPTLADRMIAHFREVADEMRMTFAQAPPGLVGTLLRRDILAELAAAGICPGQALAYKPDAPQADLVAKRCCYQVPAGVSSASGRLLADTDRAVRRIEAIVGDLGADPPAERVAEWLAAREFDVAEGLPREVEIELAGADQLAGSTLRPRSSGRGEMDLALLQRLADELGTADDVCVVLGGFGEPLLHSRFAEVLAALRRAEVFALAVRTNGLALDEAAIGAILEHGVEVVAFLLDATTATTYRHVHGHDGLQTALDRIEALRRATASAQRAVPLIACEMVKSLATYPEMEAFHDGWLRAGAWPVLTGYSDYAGRFDSPDAAVTNMAPPHRHPCRRLMSRVLVLSDGRVAICDQDFGGECIMGRLGEGTRLADVWGGEAFDAARQAHRDRRWADAWSGCAACLEWHRP